MPDLGKAVYTLVLNTATYSGPFKEAEAQAVRSTEVIGTSVSTATGKLRMLGTEAGVMGTQVAEGMTEASTAAEGAATKTVAATTAMADGSKRAAMAAEANFGRAGAAMYKFGSVGGRSLHLLGLAVLYETVRSGISTLNANTQSMAQMKNVIESTGGVAGVTAEHAADLAHHWEMVAGSERAATQGMMAVLMGFTNIRNAGTGVNAIFDRTVQAIENVSARTGKSLQQVSVAVGKAIQDPGKYMTALARTGVTFTKQQIAMAKSLWESNQPMKAQQYVLDALETRYGAANGAAAAFGKTAQGQFDIAKNKLGEASAQIMTAFLPAFVSATHAIVSFTTVLGHHAQAVKYAALAFIALKVSAIAFRTVMEGMPLIRWTLGMSRLGSAEKTTTVATRGLTTATEAETVAMDGAAVSSGGLFARLGALSLGFGPVVVAALAAAAALIYFRNQADAALKAEAAAIGLHGGGTELQRSEQMYFNRKDANYRKAGMDPTRARAQALADTRKQFNDATYDPTGQGAAAAGAGGGPAAALTKVDTGGVTKKPKAKATGLLPIQMQIEEAQSQREGAKAQIAVLNREYGYLSNLLKTTKSLPKRLEIEQQLSSIYSSLQSLKKPGSAAKGAYNGILTAKLAIAYQKALQTKGLGDDIKVLKQEESYLQNLVKNHKLSAAKQVAAMTELTRVKKKLADDLKKQKDAQDSAKHLFDQQMQAFVDTRGTFFSQFASSVFSSGPGGLSMGAAELNGSVTGGSGNGMTYNQHNTFHEIPKDRYKLSRQMQAAAAGAN